MLLPVICFDTGILDWRSAMQHPVPAHIDADVAYRRAARIGSGEKYQVARLGFIPRNHGALVKDSLGRSPGQAVNAGLGINPAHETAAVKRSRRGGTSPHIRVAKVLFCLRNQGGVAAIAHGRAGQKSAAGGNLSIFCNAVDTLRIGFFFCRYGFSQYRRQVCIHRFKVGNGDCYCISFTVLILAFLIGDEESANSR